MSKESGFRVVIAGGGIAGLTLANALEQAGVDYVLLERRDEIAPQVGASIGMLPNGCRILDQLGVLKELYKRAQLVIWMSDRDKEGRLIAPRSDTTRLGAARTGYDMAWLDRQILLQILFGNIQDKSKILLNKKITDVEHTPHGVKVKCEDKSSYEGDVLAGADGVASKTREQMWRLADAAEPGLVSKDKGRMSAEYQCLFGIALSAQDLDVGDLDIGYNTDQSSLVIVGQGGRTYYFIFQKLNTVYRMGNIPHYSTAEAAEFARQHADMKIRPDIKFADLWKSTVSFALVSLEEAKFNFWTWGRIACLGDSIHKMTPNIGAGGNASIESAAAFANAVKAMVSKRRGTGPTESQVKECLAAYQKSRERRASAVVDTSNSITRLHALKGMYQRFFVRYCVPNLGDYLQDVVCEVYIGATLLDYLPPPKASLGGNMPFNPKQGEGQKESKIERALLALPFLGLFYLAKNAMDASVSLLWVGQILCSGKVVWETGSSHIRCTFYNIKWLDDLLAPINIYFTPTLYEYDPMSRWQLITFLTDYGVVITIWAIESVRRANALTLAQVPYIFTLSAQFRGIGILSPLYYFCHYISTPIENFKATDMRLTRMNYTLGVLPTMILAYYMPLYAMMFWPTLSGRESWLFFWQMCPIWIAITNFLLTYAFPNTIMHDRIKAPKCDLPVMRYTIGTFVTLSAAVWLWTCVTSPYSLFNIFVPRAIPTRVSHLTAFSREFFKFDEGFLFTNTFLWLGYLFWDMKHAGMVQNSWLKILIYAISTILALGPGAALGLGWLWREDIVTNKRHKAAITEATAGRWNGGLARKEVN